MKLWLHNKRETPEGYIKVSNVKEAVDWVEKLEAEEKNESVELHIDPLFERCSTLINWLAINHPDHHYKVVFLPSSKSGRYARCIAKHLRRIVQTIGWEYDDSYIPRW